MPRPRAWRNAILTLILMGAALSAWENRFEPAASPYFHKNRFTGAVCHRSLECWTPNAALLQLDRRASAESGSGGSPAAPR
jgi:hypothetical protein